MIYNKETLPHVDLKLGFWAQLIEFEKELHGYNTVVLVPDDILQGGMLKCLYKRVLFELFPTLYDR